MMARSPPLYREVSPRRPSVSELASAFEALEKTESKEMKAIKQEIQPKEMKGIKQEIQQMLSYQTKLQSIWQKRLSPAALPPTPPPIKNKKISNDNVSINGEDTRSDIFRSQKKWFQNELNKIQSMVIETKQEMEVERISNQKLCDELQCLREQIERLKLERNIQEPRGDIMIEIENKKSISSHSEKTKLGVDGVRSEHTGNSRPSSLPSQDTITDVDEVETEPKVDGKHDQLPHETRDILMDFTDLLNEMRLRTGEMRHLDDMLDSGYCSVD